MNAFLVFLGFGCFMLGLSLKPLITPDKEITVTITGEKVQIKTNCNWPGDKFTFIQNGDTVMNCVYDGYNWNDVK